MGTHDQGVLRAAGRPQAGVGLLAMVMAVAAVALVAALVVTPNLAIAKDQWRVERTRERLELLTDGPTALFRFKDDVARYPGALSHLSRPITNADLSLCGNTYTNPQTGNWGARYAGRIHGTAGTPLPIGLVQDDLEWDAGASTMVLVITGVREEQARQLDRKVDGVIDPAGGRVRYTAPDPEGRVTLRWRTPVQSC